MRKIRLVLFDAFATLLVPRLPVYIQYSQTFEPYLGVLEPSAIRSSFKAALKQTQTDKPAYQSGGDAWWGEVIRRTAIGAGGDPLAVEQHVGEIVPRLLKRFASREGYRLFDDSIPCLQRLKELDIRTGLVSNTDIRMRSVMEDLGIMLYLDPVLLSEEQGVEKPSLEIFQRACRTAGVQIDEVLHVGDELKADYYGAKACGLDALLIRRQGSDGEAEMRGDDEDLHEVNVIPDLLHVVEWVERRNNR